MKFLFLPEAWDEYQMAIIYYQKIFPDLTVSFVRSVETCINDILKPPEAWQHVAGNVRRHLAKRFPFGIYYSIEQGYVQVNAVMHMSREPGYWKNRLKPELCDSSA